MKLIAGLGNPGQSYVTTRHNVGWWMLDHLADVWHFDRWRRNLKADVCAGRLDTHDVRLLKPLTYMNLSGGALLPYLRREGFVPKTDLLVVVDDVALPVGRFRMRAQGSAGGHNGLKSVEEAVGGREYARLRIGVGPPEDRVRSGGLSDYVLGRMRKEERSTVSVLFPDLVAMIEVWVGEGAERAMSRFNRVGSGRVEEGGEGTES